MVLYFNQDMACIFIYLFFFNISNFHVRVCPAGSVSLCTLHIGDGNLVTFGVCWIKLMALLT